MNADDQQQSTVLIVDDQTENLALLSRVLQPHFRVRAANSGERALAAARGEPRPDLILLDVMMPGMDGYAVLTRLRESGETRGIPIIFVTALADETDEERGFELGAVDYIAKPINPAIVLARTRTQIELKQTRDRLAEQNAQLEAKVAERTRAIRAAMDKVEAAHASLKKTYLGTLQAVGGIVELRGKGIGEHCRRVADLARRLALQMGLSPTESQDVFVAALLHDIGMIGFSDELLGKPIGAMTSKELEIYRRHPADGAAALAKIEALAGIAAIVRAHHEHYDGSGFPDGLSALTIPLGARILCAVSDYDSLRHGTLLTQPMSSKQCLQYLLDGRGGRYDPLVIDRLEPLLAQEGKFEIRELMMPVHHLHEGMLLSRDLRHPDGFLLLSKGTVLTRSLIEQLIATDKQAAFDLKVFVTQEQPAG